MRREGDTKKPARAGFFIGRLRKIPAHEENSRAVRAKSERALIYTRTIRRIGGSPFA